MKDLSPTLLKAQQEASHTPYVKVVASNRINGVVRLDWERLYNGSEDDYFHGVTMPGDGSLIRVRISLPGDGCKLYRQRIADPGPASDFSTWTYTGQYNCALVTAASLGTEISIIWINTSREIYRIKSTDNGINWNSPELIDYSPTTSVNGLSAAYKPGGDMAVFFTDQSGLYVKKHTSGNWQSMTAWDKTTGNLSGVAAVYDNDWNLLVTGKDSADNCKLWSLVYGDGGDVETGIWSELKEFASATSDGSFEYHRVFIDKPDVFRCFYIEKFTGTEIYNRPFWSYALPASGCLDNLWYEPVPFDLSSEYGVAVTHHGDYCWLSSSWGVWRAKLSEESIDLTSDVLSLKQETHVNKGTLTVELRNDDSRYSSLPPPLGTGCRLELSPGYVTSQGNEISSGPAFTLESSEIISAGKKCSLYLYGIDGNSQLGIWKARHQFRWNKTTGVKSVKDILVFLLARVGLTLEIISQSAVISGYYPDFTIQPEQNGDVVLKKLLSFIPDVLFVEGDKAYIVNPQSSDNSVYSYGQTHPVYEGRYRDGAWDVNRLLVEGYDPVEDERIFKESFSWNQINKLNDRLQRIEDINIETVTGAGQRGEAYLRKTEIESSSGYIRIPVNCGQQLYDVIDITDVRAGLVSVKKRISGIILIYNPGKGQYTQQLLIGTV